MTDTAKPHGEMYEAAQTFVGRLRHWWHSSNELDGLSKAEIARIAGEFGMTGSEFESLAAKGPDAADLIYQRMAVIGLTRADVEHISASLMRDLEKTCSGCRDKGQCVMDLKARPDDPAWKRYCPNAETFDDISTVRFGERSS